MSTDRLYPNLNECKDEDQVQNENNHISLELAEKMLFKFDGNKNKLYEFIDNCQKAMQFVRPHYKKLLLGLIETKLTDNARALIRNRHFSDWETLKTHLLDAYSEKRTTGQWQLELNSCKQNLHENVMTFASKVENCYVKLLNTLDESLSREARNACINLLKSQALNVFITGLNKDLTILVKSQCPKSLEDAISIALNEEQELKSKFEIQKYQNISNINSNYRHCTNCNKSGHTSYNCKLKNSPTNSRQIRHVNNYDKPQNQNFKSNKQNSKFCNYCKNSGHLIDECRKREYFNNKKKSYQNQNKSYQNQNKSYTKIPLNANSLRDEAKPRDANMIKATFQQ